MRTIEKQIEKYNKKILAKSLELYKEDQKDFMINLRCPYCKNIFAVMINKLTIYSIKKEQKNEDILNNFICENCYKIERN